MYDRATSLINKVAPNVELPALAFACIAIVVGIVPMLAAVDVFHQPDSAFPSGRATAFIGGLVFFTGGLYVLIARALARTKPMQALRKPLVSLFAAIMMFSFAAIPCAMLVLGTPGNITVSCPFVSFTFHSVIADKIVLTSIAAMCAVVAIACFYDFVQSMKRTPF